ncbi:hypothetical protein LLF88_00980 [bacterium]|nr:hypothetical protein [bacterium]
MTRLRRLLQAPEVSDLVKAWLLHQQEDIVLLRYNETLASCRDGSFGRPVRTSPLEL